MSDFPVMLARNFAATRVRKWSTSVVVEPKIDGVRVIVRVMPSGRATFFSRNGRVLTMFDHLMPPLAEVARPLVRRLYADGGLMLDGEMTSGTRFERIGGAIHRKDHTETDAVLHVFFAMPWSLFIDGRDEVDQLERLEAMDACDVWGRYDNVRRLTATRVMNAAEVGAAAQRFMDEGYEGAMVKQLDVPYGNRRSYDWMKVKGERTVDLKVTSLQPGRGKYEGTLGALVVTYKGVEVPVSGMTDEQRDAWWARPKRIIGRTIEVQYQYVTPKGSLRHPRFKRLRPDKD